MNDATVSLSILRPNANQLLMLEFASCYVNGTGTAFRLRMAATFISTYFIVVTHQARKWHNSCKLT